MISNHYWQCYNTTFALLQCLLFFGIEIIITLFGVIVLLPLTLWRMPTFLILFRTHKYSKRYFFKILFPMYKQMGIDVLSLFIRVPVFLMFPRAYLTFHYKTSFKYTKQGIDEFSKIQRVKIRYVT